MALHPTALIAEDEPLLAAALQTELAHAWPELRVLATVGDGHSAVAQALVLKPDVLFFDIRMPGQTGLDAAAELAERWETGAAGARPFPALVFVTAYDDYAVQAFDAQAADYLLKPVQVDRLQKTVEKLRKASVKRSFIAMESEASMEPVLAQLRALLAPQAANPVARLSVIPASLAGTGGASIRMVPVDEVLYFEAADKYVRVLTASAEYLIRTPLKELLPQLDAQTFWQVHRSTVVRASEIDTVTRDEAGKFSLSLRGRTGKLPVSRLYAHLFKAM
ncbi:LytTR family DNA-binding domain-containing protein [Rhodoferax sp.]|uniref:LytR/AlgR family response regulator transcription factor n=1 Tax=Rhodoferax sp. TaxID=50421 RepID=UPI002631B48A|nr:LytTR family DNA-binding domain-containing protein [Rhodoferax sp.]MDD2926696.1 LytTR family DNA-binding domain-containing protein [Rhodoferax sp.]